MSRDSSGNYSLPLANVVTGTTISSNWANTSFSDFATEFTNSLDRTGRGGMLAPLRCADGSAAAPSFSFTSETGSGLYLAGVNDMRLVMVVSALQKWTPTAVTIYPATTVDDALTVTGGVTATNATANGVGTTSTGTGTGAGLVGKGGSSSGPGVVGLANGTALPLGTSLSIGGIFLGSGQTTVAAIATNVGVYGIGGPASSSGNGGHGIVGRGADAAASGGGGAGLVGLGGAVTAGTGSGGFGVSGVGGATFGGTGGTGGSFTGGTPTAGNLNGGAGMSAAGGSASGSGAPGIGGIFAAGAAASATVRRTAISATNGDISLDGVTGPNSDVAIKNAVTPDNICKAFAKVSTSGAGAVTVSGGFNITAAISGTAVRFTFPTGGAMANANYTVAIAHAGSEGVNYYVSAQTTGYFDVSAFTYALNGPGTAVVSASVLLSTTAQTFHVSVHGRQ